MGGIAKCSGGGGVRCSGGGWARCACFKQARLCADNTLADVWMKCDDAATFPNAFSITATGVCYYFAGDSGTPGTLFAAADATAFVDCATCNNPCPCDDASLCTNYLLTFKYLYKRWNTACDDGAPLTVCPVGGVPGDGAAELIAGTACNRAAADGSISIGCGGQAIIGVKLNVNCPSKTWTLDFNLFGVAHVTTTSVIRRLPAGAYPDIDVCRDLTAFGAGYQRFTITNINLVCDDAP